MAAIEKGLRRMPKITVDELNKAIKKSIFEIYKQAQDNSNTEFANPTPRLQPSFAETIQFGNLRGTIGPNVEYAGAVYYGIGQRANPYLDRILEASMDYIDEAFNEAAENVVKQL